MIDLPRRRATPKQPQIPILEPSRRNLVKNGLNL